MSSQPAIISVLKRTITMVLLSMLMCCLGSAGGFQLDRVDIKSQIRIQCNLRQLSLHVLYTLWLPDLCFW